MSDPENNISERLVKKAMSSEALLWFGKTAIPRPMEVTGENGIRFSVSFADSEELSITDEFDDETNK